MTDLNEKLGIEFKIPDPLQRKNSLQRRYQPGRYAKKTITRRRPNARDQYAKKQNKVQQVPRRYFKPKNRW